MDLSELITQLILFAAAFFASLMASVSGGGAGFVNFPLLVLLGLPFITALGTHKVSMLMLGAAALFKGRKQHVLRKNISAIFIVCGTPCVIAGTYTISLIDEHKAQTILGIITLLMAIYSLFNKKFSVGTTQTDLKRSDYVKGCIALSLVAFFSGGLSSGAGLFATLSMTQFLKISLKEAISYSMVFVAAYWNLVGAIVAGSIGGIYYQWLPVLLSACFLGSLLGAYLLDKLSTKAVKYIFCTVAALSGILLLYNAAESWV